MTDKKKEQKTVNKTSSIPEKVEQPEKLAKIDQTDKADKKVGIVEEAKKELKKLEEEQKNNPQSDSKPFPWNVFLGAALLTAGAIILGSWANATLQVNKIEKSLPQIVEALGGGMEVANIGKPKKVSGIFQFSLSFKDMDQEFTSSITPDGKLFFVDGGISVKELLDEMSAANANKPPAAATCETLEKTETPVLSVYVSSDCSYCKQVESKIVSAVKQAPALANQIKVRYAGTIDENNQVISFLGSPEAGQENLRQVCIRDEQVGAYWDYLSCMASDGNSEGCMKSARVDTPKVNACMEDPARGFTAIQADINQANVHALQGTPSFYVNETQNVSDIDFGGRVPDSYKQILCCASSNQADFCSTTLSE